ncbi:hypothetical protein ABIA52_000057 [Paenarthrobacter histidinolovorans]|uniref:Uncharacterized protein n=1 Tax=Paenarthrobacter histidinolovorans TaxID=43664 RepID=A0ABW8MZM2_9MICC
MTSETVSRSAGVIAKILRENRNDVMSLGLFAHYVLQGHPQDRHALRLVRRLLDDALRQGLFTAGDMIENEFRAWRSTGAESVERIHLAWPAREDPTFEDLRDICWLANTEKGDRAVCPASF